MKEYVKFIVIGALAGAVNGIFGAGAGMLLVPLLSHWGGLEYRRALATSVCIVLPMSLVSAFIYLRQDMPELTTLLPYLAGGLAGGFLGGRIFKKIPLAVIRRIFAAFIIYGGVRNLL